MIVAIIDYGSGNLRSAAKAFERAAAENAIAAEIVVTSVPEIVAGADRVVLPGVGAFADCRRGLAAVPGLDPAGIQARQTACRSTGADEDVFLLSRGAANFALFEPRRNTALVAVGNDPEPATSVDREGITRAVAGMPLLGNAAVSPGWMPGRISGGRPV